MCSSIGCSKLFEWPKLMASSPSPTRYSRTSQFGEGCVWSALTLQLGWHTVHTGLAALLLENSRAQESLV